MRTWLLTLMALLTVMAGNASPASARHKSNLMALDPFERACVLIRHYETLHTVKNWPTIAYGHVVQKGEKFKKRNYSHAEADRILRKDLSKLCAYYRSYGRDSLLLACLAYNVAVVVSKTAQSSANSVPETETSTANTPPSPSTKVAVTPASIAAAGSNLNSSSIPEQQPRLSSLRGAA